MCPLACARCVYINDSETGNMGWEGVRCIMFVSNRTPRRRFPREHQIVEDNRIESFMYIINMLFLQSFRTRRFIIFVAGNKMKRHTQNWNRKIVGDALISQTTINCIELTILSSIIKSTILFKQNKNNLEKKSRN